MGDAKENEKTGEVSGTQSRRWRGVIAAIIAILVVGYTVVVLIGVIAPSRRLSATDLILLALAGGVIAVIIRPEALQAISSLSVGSVRVELQKVQDIQLELAKRQETQLQLLQEIFPLLLPDNVLKHLQNLEDGERGRLRYMHLIEVIPPHKGIGDIPDSKFALPEYVRLTHKVCIG